jgi:membrane associated rhomboid family serine protease
MDDRHRELVKDAAGPWGARDAAPQDPGGGARPAAPAPREPAINLPWPVIVLLVVLLGCYLAQRAIGDAKVDQLTLSLTALREGRWWTLVSYIFLHASWTHLGLNCLSAVAFAAPVARYFGTGALGALRFFAFYIVCGVASGLGVVALGFHPGAVVGASGAISGLIGAAARLMDRRGALSPILTRSVYSLGGSWIGLNLVMAFVGPATNPEGLSVAWEGHIVGLVTGILIIGLFGAAAPPHPKT